MSKLTKPLTDKDINNALSKEKEYKLFDGGGLYITIAPKGGKWWRIKYNFEGRENRLSLGVYPAVSIVEARKRKEHIKAQISMGINPSLARKESKTKKPNMVQDDIAVEQNMEPLKVNTDTKIDDLSKASMIEKLDKLKNKERYNQDDPEEYRGGFRSFVRDLRRWL